MTAPGSERQHIPRPPGARPGGPPPWAGAPPERLSRIGLDRVRRAVRESGPAEPWPAPAAAATTSAVLVPVFEEEGETRVILTRRTTWLRSHSGQIAFPGGRLEPEEEPLEAALREAAEEVDLDPSTVEILGQLAPLITMSRGSAITPFVGALEGRPVLSPNPDEVDIVFDVALADLLREDVFREEIWDIPDFGEREVYFFEVEQDTVWGATARVLYELLELVTGT